MKKGLVTIILSLFVLIIFGQTDEPVAMGKWRTHLAYNSVTQIAQSANNIYAVSDGALFSVSKTDTNDQNFYSKMSGLSDANIVKIDFDKANNQLLIIYLNGNIDIMHSAGVNNIPDLHNKQMSSGKGVNHVFFKGDSAYLSCDFGILLLNMKRKEISDTYIIGTNSTEVKILSTTIYNGKIYAVTANSVYSANANNHNLVNYEFWENTSGLPGSGSYQSMFSFAGKLMLLRGNKLYKQDTGGVWKLLFDEDNNGVPEKTITTINVSNGKLIAGDGSNTLYLLDESFNKSEINVASSPDIEYDTVNDIYWLAGLTQGIISYQSTTGKLNNHKPLGPAVNIPWDITFAGEKMFMVAGGRWAGSYNTPGQVMIYENNMWKNISGSNIQTITKSAALDFVNVAVDPADNTHFFVTSYGNGLYEFKNDAFVNWYHHNSPNSTIETAVPGSVEYSYIRLDGAVYDKDGNLFFANMGSTSAIKILLNTGEWSKLYYPSSALPTLGKIVISNLNPNQKWVPSVRYTPGIFIWDDNGTLKDQSDDKNIFISKLADIDNVGSNINPTYYYCLVQDKNGVFWAGTDMGPLLFYNPSKAFDEGYTCSRVKIPRNDGTGLADYLLQNEKIKAIAIDGANRKWIGTETSGLYLMSENGQETILHFTSKNSPLLSDNIMSLSINPVSGEVFIGTNNGLISYQSDAAESSDVYTNVYAYPNPVRENYNGIITITGLIANTQVKITDLNGNLIYQTVSNGSIATWDGKDVHGRKVSTGIYMAICANEDGTKSTITKIMVIN
ncbi:MAG: two-component regulator propeller domain-containing protein [Paludibacter sp.]|nr:two-component regulator propeller domain-containing protein [Paludibacter sp.]